MTDFVVRPIMPPDASAIARLWLTCTAEVARQEPVYTPGISADALTERLRAEFTAGRKFGWVADAGDTLAGYVTCLTQTEAPVFVSRNFVYVVDLDVAPEHRKRGLSRLLMQQVEDYARSHGIERLELSVAYRDPRARAVWERHGFQPHLLQLHKDL